MKGIKILRMACIFALTMVFSCSESGGGSGPVEEVKESVGLTDDGHDVVVFQRGDLDEVLFKIDTVSITDTSFLGRLYFRNMPANKTPVPGDIINSSITKNAPYGFLYRVVEVAKEGEDVTVVTVKYASIAEAVKEADVKFTAPLVYNEEYGQFLEKCSWRKPWDCVTAAVNWAYNDVIKPAGDIAEDAWNKTVSTVKLIAGNADVNKIEGTSFEVHGSVPVGTQNVGGEIKVDGKYAAVLLLDLQLREYKIQKAEMSVTQNQYLNLEAKLKGKFRENKSSNLQLYPLKSIEFLVGPITVVIETKAIVQANYEINAQADIDGKFTFSEESKYGFEYNIYTKKFEKIDENRRNYDYNVKHSAFGDVRVGFSAGVRSLLYGACGLDLTVGPSFALTSSTTNLSANSETKFSIDFDLNMAMVLQVDDWLNERWPYSYHIPLKTFERTKTLPSFTIKEYKEYDGGIFDGQELQNDKFSIPFEIKRDKSGLGFFVDAVGYCIETNKGECISGSGKRGTVTKDSRYNKSENSYYIGMGSNERFIADFEDLTHGTYNVIPYFKTYGGEIYYDTASAVNNYCTYQNKTINLETEFCSPSGVGTLCGGKSYDLSTQFCFDNTIYDKCNGWNNYNPLTQFCASDKRIYDLCGGNSYDPQTQFCLDNAIYDKCGNSSYNPKVYFCSDNELLRLCGGEIYDPSTKFCYGVEIHDLCGGQTYNPSAQSIQFCLGDVLYGKCGIDRDQTYDPSIKFCSGRTLYDLCGGNSYEPGTQSCCLDKIYDRGTEFCYSQKTYDKCGGNSYEPLTQFCSGNEVWDKCDGQTYNTSAKFCYNKTLYDLCGSYSYNPSTSFCFNNETVIKKCDGKTFDLSKGEMCCGTKIFNNGTQSCSNGEITNKTKDYCVYDEQGNGYECVIIGEQTWLKTNLNSDVPGSKCYDDIFYNCITYGRLYDWETAQDICPEGWHLPSKEEWQVLRDYAGGSNTSVSGKNLQATWDWAFVTGGGPNYSYEYIGTDYYGFSALGGGQYKNNYEGLRNMGYWWSSTVGSYNELGYYFQINPVGGIGINSDDKTNLRSVRCVKD